MSWISLSPTANSEPSNSVSFPVSESPQKQVKPVSPLKGPHLPFRRISLPTAPSLQHRISVASVASFDSLHEDGDVESPRSTRLLSRVPENPDQSRQSSSDPARRRKRARDASTKPADERQVTKRRNIVEEFYETEKTYVDGLELIYSVSIFQRLFNSVRLISIPIAFSDSNHRLS